MENIYVCYCMVKFVLGLWKNLYIGKNYINSDYEI